MYELIQILQQLQEGHTIIIMPILQRKKLRHRRLGNLPKVIQLAGIQTRHHSLCPEGSAKLGTQSGSAFRVSLMS